jgi:hypothetical protein
MTGCIERGCPYGVYRRSRCREHYLAEERRRRPTTTQRGYGADWQRFTRERVLEVGMCQTRPRCPYPDSGNPLTNPLTTDHVTLGLVLCRRCNSAKQHADRGVSKSLERGGPQTPS